MSEDVAARVEDTFDNLSQDFFNLQTMVSTCRGDADEGCGEFAGDMQAYTPNFENAWKQTFEVASSSAALIAGNTNKVQLDLLAVDRDHSHQTPITI